MCLADDVSKTRQQMCLADDVSEARQPMCLADDVSEARQPSPLEGRLDGPSNTWGCRHMYQAGEMLHVSSLMFDV